jgi:acetylornithine deacetylase/succinyl-diaminopimelate desuccinylase-like protein
MSEKAALNGALERMDLFLPALDYIDNHLSEYVEDAIRICEVPAPTFQEERRALFFASRLRELGLSPEIDEAGNVTARVFELGRPHVVLSAHLDTVFSFESIRVVQQGAMLRAPGISDDSAGLAALLLLCRAFLQTKTIDRGTLTVLATVGEEGLGDLRGVRHFFDSRKDVDHFISLDGCDAERIVHQGLASKRVRIFFRGPGGHSWGDAGMPNPIYVAGELLGRIHRLKLPVEPKTTINVGIISGGTSVNTIPAEVHLDVDLRSESSESLVWLDEYLQKTIREVASAADNIRAECRVVGERPSGSLSADHPMVQKAVSAGRLFGLQSHLISGSTDSNVPFALGIPALTLGVGGMSGKIHTPDEWYDVTGSNRGLKRTALLIGELLHNTQ